MEFRHLLLWIRAGKLLQRRGGVLWRGMLKTVLRSGYMGSRGRIGLVGLIG